ncbi:MAG: hypothetical protein R3D05_16440 [Dongiaceae bacterium]
MTMPKAILAGFALIALAILVVGLPPRMQAAADRGIANIETVAMPNGQLMQFDMLTGRAMSVCWVKPPANGIGSIKVVCQPVQ